jgi:hypothetical protein
MTASPSEPAGAETAAAPPAAFARALERAFATLASTLRWPTRKASAYARSLVNPYPAVLVMLARRPPALALLERAARPARQPTRDRVRQTPGHRREPAARVGSDARHRAHPGARGPRARSARRPCTQRARSAERARRLRPCARLTSRPPPRCMTRASPRLRRTSMRWRSRARSSP